MALGQDPAVPLRTTRTEVDASWLVHLPPSGRRTVWQPADGIACSYDWHAARNTTPT